MYRFKYWEFLLNALFRILKIDGNFNLDLPVNSVSNSPINVQFNQNKCAIILQGPIQNFELLLEYLIHYINSDQFKYIVVSTWVGELDANQLGKITSFPTVHVIQNLQPEFPGVANVNLQIESTRAALKFLRLNDFDGFVIKSRTDQVLLAMNLADYLLCMAKEFGIKHEKLKYRLLVGSFNTYKFRPYSISDMFMFGHLGDMLLYWDIPLDTNKVLKSEIENPRTMKDWSLLNIAEVYLTATFMRSLNVNIDYTIKSYWSLLVSYFIVLDSSSLGFRWEKYTNNGRVGTYTQYNLRERFFYNLDWWIIRENMDKIDFEKTEKHLEFYENTFFEKN
jgi:hypothetical protein